MYDRQTRCGCQIQWVSWNSGITWKILHRRIPEERESEGSVDHQPPPIGLWDKRLPGNTTVFAVDATAIIQAIEGEDVENAPICHIMNPLELSSER